MQFDEEFNKKQLQKLDEVKKHLDFVSQFFSGKVDNYKKMRSEITDAIFKLSMVQTESIDHQAAIRRKKVIVLINGCWLTHLQDRIWAIGLDESIATVFDTKSDAMQAAEAFLRHQGDKSLFKVEYKEYDR